MAVLFLYSELYLLLTLLKKQVNKIFFPIKEKIIQKTIDKLLFR